MAQISTGKISRRIKSKLSFDEVRVYAQQLNIKGCKEWWAWAKTEARPDNIPANPNVVYSNDGWAGWKDFLRTGKMAGVNRR